MSRDGQSGAVTRRRRRCRSTVVADPADCSFQFNPVGTAKFTNSCDIAKGALARASVDYTAAGRRRRRDRRPAIEDRPTQILGAKSADASPSDLGAALTAVGYPAASNPSVVKLANPFDIFRAAAVHAGADPDLPGDLGDHGLRPDRRGAGRAVPDPIRYTSMSLPYQSATAGSAACCRRRCSR